MRPESTVYKMASMFRPYRVARPVFTVIRGYFDESGREPEIFSLTCVLAKPSNWGFLINDWLGVIEEKNLSLAKQGRQPLSRFHAVDCSNFAGEFKGWNEPERREFLAKLINVFERPANGMNAVGFSIRLESLVKDIPETAPDPRGFAYALLLKVIMEEIGSMVSQANRGNISQIKMPFVHERCPYDSVLLRSFNDLIGNPGFRYKSLFPSLAPLGWEDCPFLQPTDMMAYENYKEDERFITGRDRRYPLRKLLSGEMFGGKAGCYDEAGMARLTAHMTKELKDELLIAAKIKKAKTSA